MTEQKIVPSIWCNGNAEEVAEFYRSVLPQTEEVGRSHYPSEGLRDFQAAMAGQVLTLDFTVRGYQLCLINAGPEFTPNPMLSFMLNFDPSTDDEAGERLDAVWAGLAEGGNVLMPLKEYPFSKHYGWVQDRFGVSWQLILTDPEGEPRPFVVPALMFANDNVNRAEEAITYYASLFEDGRVGTLARYEQEQGAASQGSLMFGEFAVGNQWFAAMDSPARHEFDYNEGISLMVDCRDQAEIDYFWDKLSRVPEAEICGWCKDQFGVSWQIAPLALNQTLEPADFAAMMEMKKVVIADFPGAAARTAS